MNETNMDVNVVLSILKLSRAMRRCPPPRKEFPFPPAIGRLLECVAANPGISSRDLCEALDLRPSSLSETLARAESDGLLTRSADEEDRRMQHITLSEKGLVTVREMEEMRLEDAQKKASCLTEEEKQQFCALCEKLSGHIESLALDLPEGMMPPPPPRPECVPGPRPECDPGPRLPRPSFGKPAGEGPGREIPPGKRFRS